nr:PREDICTED: complement C4-B-like [Struthio camelus australis]
MVAPGRVALGVPVGVLLQATEPVAGMLVARAQGAAEEVESCSAEVPFALTPHNDFSQLLHLKVSPEQAARCGLVAKEGGRALLLEARSPQLPPTGSQHLRVTWGGPRGHLFVQTDKPIYAPRQTDPPKSCRTPKSPKSPKCLDPPKSGGIPQTPRNNPKSSKSLTCCFGGPP